MRKIDQNTIICERKSLGLLVIKFKSCLSHWKLWREDTHTRIIKIKKEKEHRPWMSISSKLFPHSSVAANPGTFIEVSHRPKGRGCIESVCRFQPTVAASEVNHWPARAVWAGHVTTGNRKFSHKLHWPCSQCFNVFYAMALQCALQTYQPLLVKSPQCSPPSHSVTGALVLLQQSEFTHGGRVDSSLLPGSNPVRGHVLSLVLYTLEYSGSKKKNETSHPFCYINSLLPLFVQMVSTNNIIVQSRYCETAAGNVSSAPFPASIRQSSTWLVPLLKRRSAY